MAELNLNLDAKKLGAIAGGIVVAVIALGVYQSVQALEDKVAGLEAQIEQLEAFADQVDALAMQVQTVQADVVDIARSRDDILEAICRVLDRPPEQCGLSRSPP